MNDDYINPASKQEVIELREEVRRLREEQEKLKQSGNGRGTAEEKHESEKDEEEGAAKGDKEKGDAGNKPESAFRRHRKPIILGIVVVLFLAGLIWWLYSRQFEDTDDATVDGHISAIAARIASPVIGVYTDENAYVKTGQLLADLDPKDFEVAVEQAQGQLLQAQGQSRAELPNVPVTQVTNQTEIAVANSAVSAAEAGVAAAEKNYEAALQKVRESEANNSKAQADVERYRPLAAKDEVPQEQFAQVQANAQSLAASVSADQANARAVERQVQQAREQLSQAQTRAAEALENAPRQLAIRRANVASREAGMEAAQAALDQARLNLSYCKVVSPVEGVVAKRIAEVGQHVAPGQQLFLISQINDLWVTANFRETQLRLMRAGQSVRIHVDAIDKDFDGYVESMPAASGAVTSLLPPENATGNFVKVVQRLPVRIRFKPNQQGLERLRPGMSVEPKVRVR